MVSLRTAFAFGSVSLISLAISAAARASPGCADLMPVSSQVSPRPLVPEDLVRLRDIGPVDPNQQYGGLFSVSPDGKHAAFQLRRADPVTNSYCLAMIVVDLRAGGKAVVVDRGGTFLRLRYDFRGKARFPSGFADPVTPRWSPDGKWLVFRKRDGAAVQLWRVMADGSASAPVTESRDDIDDFRISADGRSIVYASRPGFREASADIEREGLSGFHYDDRFAPSASTRPFVPAPVARLVTVLDIAASTTRPATPAEARMLDQPVMQEGNWTEARSAAGARAFLQVPVPTLYPSRGRLAATIGGRVLACDASECRDASFPWWVGDTVRFIRREGWAGGATAVYAWRPGAPQVRLLYRTEDLLLSCVPTDGKLTCLREGATQPRRLERLDLKSGRRELVFEPNPEFADLRLGRVERLYLRNRFGIASFADLVLPVGYVPGRRYPLVAVQYTSRGFLRGGTGDDYPIQAFANRGFAVLSFDRPAIIGLKAAPDLIAIERMNLRDFVDRRSILDSLEVAVRTVIARGIADPARIGITGLSDGASTAGFALLHSRLFSAYAMSSCCWDTNLAMRFGPAAASEFYAMGYPKATDDSAAARAFWQQIALSPNAQNIRAPILAQVADDELLSALQSFTALRELDRPIDLFVFPDEHHVKWQPAHRLAVYTRALDWFDFWLNGIAAPGREVEVGRWQKMRAELAKDTNVPAQVPVEP